MIALDGLDHQLIVVLTALCRTNSIREAAAVHCHHSAIPRPRDN
ncbi:hypothetical protein [Kibdelosporangium phytohabitans]|nr:hypothetical protein [Kibdelosporangium phytohabitans]MBE1464040.1 hypothetical protein [Kibdelosporangium phytohabitans]